MTDKQKSDIAQREEEILSFWREHDIFKKTLEKPSPEGNFVFYDGPPFATGLPHYGHLLAGTMKDVIPRYQTMRGKYVRRIWGWDCHGLPIENLIQKELGVHTKKDIEELGIQKFNDTARESVFRYDDEWRKVVPRTGRFVDMDDQYTTMDTNFTESVWWGFKELFKKDLVYEDFKSMHLSPLLETPLSNFEVNQNYKDIEDISIFVEFKLKDEPNTSLIAWTTTPWTLPGNVALAVGEDIDYVKVEKIPELSKGETDAMVQNYFYIAKDIFDREVSISDDAPDYKNFLGYLCRVEGKSIKGKDLIGKEYEPVFDYYAQDDTLENRENGWKVYGADFVTTEDGTGIVHIAPAFGEDDLNLGREYNLPFVQHVNMDGTIKEEVTDFAGRVAKPKSTKEEPKKHQETDIEVLKTIAHKGLLFAKKKYVHSYPHCWRTDAPLLNYAMSSWFIKVTAIKDDLLKTNSTTNWVPSDIRDGRFGKWLEGARDWAVSRNRYWGASMPIWQSEDKKETEVIGSIEELQEKRPDILQDIYLMRHGESEKNILGIYDRELETYPLTETGKKQAQEATQQLQNIDLVIASPVRRAKETAEIVAQELGCPLELRDELMEVDSGEWEGRKEEDIEERDEYLALPEEEFFTTKRGTTGESWKEVEERAVACLLDVLQKHPDKKILFVTHAGIVVSLSKYLNKKPLGQTRGLFRSELYNKYATPIHFVIDRNEMKAFDFHRPYIDNITWKNEGGQEMKRIEAVFDTWIDSGSMPFAQVHYPFENKEVFEQNDSPLFPADFIAEGLDQTRGWFYTLLVLNTALFNKAPFKNVIVNGLVLAEDGKKMSKSLKNYPEISYILDKYGADAMRYYMLASPIVKAEDLAFSEKGVDEVVKKIIRRLSNVHSFYELYNGDEKHNTIPPQTQNTLDIWMLARLSELTQEVTSALDAFELDKASRPFNDFIDDLSTWYLRRSRDRLKEGSDSEKKEALHTLSFVLRETAKLLAPFMPFLAEDIWQKMKNEGEPESVHLLTWPEEKGTIDETLLSDMKLTRSIVTDALELRSKENIKVRQPLQSLTIPNTELKGKEGLLVLIQEELNVKEVIIGDELTLDTTITPELQKEGAVRDIIRGIQALRKTTKLVPEDEIILTLQTTEELQNAIEEYKKDIQSQVNATTITYTETPKGEVVETALGDITLSLEKKG